MVLQIDLIDETKELSNLDLEFIENLLGYAAAKEQIDDGTELSVTFVTNENIQEINKTYRGKDQPTDVISFALEEIGEDEIEIKGVHIPRILGDIIISVEKAQEQAEEYGHSFKRELGFLAIHGFLHLLGYDHMNENDEKRMFARQTEILDGYGLER
ncbi:rRNA maturation RNase YbeY [Lederbergia citrea]|uniref:Endoribonuclease YbeY n=1 Tax=Lederbergia citrea TaxID=2833581 RepID=A0A942UP49_9BACI|nr:rRNA maturation RNase YbeY [Lederbergia citrea]MBS4176296.1 rRNA maturation RNase YbeY [Lederbergia citrea]MBS4202857.1 rRNA maturation RNase YbeY [Lederbergia citrea]MBS4222476.1 rRNA maturation RNase YbeY [Lederbergia citrea]